jgi:pimeloyl-ACP methyl ester carboxylesterase
VAMDYETARDREITIAYDALIEDLVDQNFRAGMDTIVLLPGGMGSQLDQSRRPFSGKATQDLGPYDPIWVDLGLLFDRDARGLEIEADGRDKGGHIVRPSGPIHFFTFFEPYAAPAKHFQRLGYNFIVFPYDWRRPLTESADYLERFLRRLGSRVEQRRGENPLPRTTLLCHSMGGLVAKVFMHRAFSATAGPAQHDKLYRRIITAGTPFYGTSTHVQRYYRGEELLSRVGYSVKEMTRIVGSLPGPYVLNYLDRKTFQSAGAVLGLPRYPMRDDNVANEADPLDPANVSNFGGVANADHMDLARRTFAVINKPLNKGLIDRVFSIRGGTSQPTAMSVEQRWSKTANGAYRAPEALAVGPGDGTVPAWSARLAQTETDAPNHVFDPPTANDHQTLLENGQVLDAIEHAIVNDAFPPPTLAPSIVEPAARSSREEVAQLMDKVASGAVPRTDPAATNPADWQRLLEEITR